VGNISGSLQLELTGAGGVFQLEAAMGELFPLQIPGGEHLQYIMFPGARDFPQPEAAMEELFPPRIPGGEHLLCTVVCNLK